MLLTARLQHELTHECCPTLCGLLASPASSLTAPEPCPHCIHLQAFGNAVAPYLPASFIGPTWANRLVEFFALLQIMGCYQVGQRWHVSYRITTCAGWPVHTPLM